MQTQRLVYVLQALVVPARRHPRSAPAAERVDREGVLHAERPQPALVGPVEQIRGLFEGLHVELPLAQAMDRAQGGPVVGAETALQQRDRILQVRLGLPHVPQGPVELPDPLADGALDRRLILEVLLDLLRDLVEHLPEGGLGPPLGDRAQVKNVVGEEVGDSAGDAVRLLRGHPGGLRVLAGRFGLLEAVLRQVAGSLGGHHAPRCAHQPRNDGEQHKAAGEHRGAIASDKLPCAVRARRRRRLHGPALQMPRQVGRQGARGVVPA